MLPATSFEQMIVFVSMDKVTKVAMSMHSCKALRSDGNQPFFFKNYWQIVGKDIWKMVYDVFCYGSND
ncbi:hypothetical protein Lalb_Chr10g0095611 [Lupinus albus]|uniref:Uncharacterized protein n=1 Tax=Lupinus albus TaxID=3870 RepID=A0A6A4PUS8_LUPAL|nr:hypothetical protein Lalb_Chr10g0095611 [Lupinus albus]